MTLRFQVQGSGKLPYRITAEGEGSELKAFCSCPAGRRGGMFCKHVAALLMGDVTKLVQPSDDVEELKRRAQGSPLFSKAVSHNPEVQDKRSDSSVTGKTIKDIALTLEPRLKAAGLKRQYSEDEFGESILMIRPDGSRGYVRRSALLSLSYTPSIQRIKENGDIFETTERVKPWTLTVNDRVPRSWATLERAYPAFMEALEALEKNNNK